MKSIALSRMIATAGVGVFCWWQNNSIQTSIYHLSLPTLPPSFEGYRLAQVSDLHNKCFGKNQNRLLSEIQNFCPNMIVITGDLTDTTDYDHALCFVQQALQIAPVYYVSGNHESRYGMVSFLCKKITALGGVVLNNQHHLLEHHGEYIALLGADDPTSYGGNDDQRNKAQFNQMLRRLKDQVGSHFSMLLSHRPEYIFSYASVGFDVVLSGHAHGGQFQLPFIGGLMSPGQGWFPSYTNGIYKKKDTTLVVSRGLGNGTFPLRLGNRPHIVGVVLHQPSLKTI